MDEILHTCKYCGAPGVDYAEAREGVVRCTYCGNVNDVPRKQPPTEVVFALNNADNELYNCRFEEARDSYSKVIAMSPDEPQAYFGRALAKFRVKYLKNERYSTESEAKYQPICYSVTDKLFSKDPDYLKALALATDKQQDIYTEQAQEIDTIVSDFQALKQKGVDYDTFICCKVTDDATKQKTRDAYDAQRIYINLQNKGFKPFFSEMDMGDFTGSEYEAVILYALYTSESMLIVCSNEDYLDTPWVKNEYSRFLAMTANGYKQQGSLTFVYSGKPIEKLPNGKKIQGIDRNAYGSSEKIVDFVRKFLPQSQFNTKFCASCGAEVPAKTKFCPECGNREFVATHDEFVAAQALAQARKEQQEREEQLKKQQAEREELLKKQQAEREEQLRREQQARDEELAALRRQLEEERNRTGQQTTAASLAAQRAKAEAERKAKEDAERKAHDETARKAKLVQEDIALRIAEKNLKLQLNADGKSYSVVGHNGDPQKITFPAQYKGLPVTHIAEGAFDGCSSLDTIIMPGSVVSIGEKAFAGCTHLTSIPIPSSVIYIGDSAFERCDSLTSITIPSSVTSIGSNAFSFCGNLTSITIPSSVTNIKNEAFFYCRSLTSLTIPSSVTDIGDSAFEGCSSLTSITVPNSVKRIGSYAFRYCNSFTSITIPSSVTNIESEAFSGCSSLTIYCEVAKKPNGWDSDWNVYLKMKKGVYDGSISLQRVTSISSVTSLQTDDDLNSYCPVVWSCLDNDVATDGYTYMTVNNVRYGLKDNKVTVVRNNNCSGSIKITSQVEYKGKQYPVIAIDEKAFEDCRSLKTVTFEGDSQLRRIGSNAFSFCGNLTSITIPNSVTSIGENAFCRCSSLKSITIPNNITSIGALAFSSCRGLTSVTIPGSVTSIGMTAFYDCSSLTIYCKVAEKPYGWHNDWNVYRMAKIEDGYRNYSCPVVWNCLDKDVATDGYIYTIVNNIRYGLKENRATVAHNNYSGNIIIFSEVKFKGKQYPVTTIGEEAFSGCVGLTWIIIPSSVTSIGEKSFDNCSSLASITIPSSVKNIGSYVFNGCSKLTQVTMPKRLAGFMGSKLKDIFGDRYKQIKFTFTK